MISKQHCIDLICRIKIKEERDCDDTSKLKKIEKKYTEMVAGIVFRGQCPKLEGCDLDFCPYKK